MKHSTDDFTEWRIRQAHLSQPFPYVFPKMPPRFRRFRALGRGIFLLQWASFAAFITLLFSSIFLLNSQPPKPLGFGLILSLFLTDLFIVLRFVLGRFWRCPCCKTRFPYYRPSSYCDTLVNADLLQTMGFLGIAYIKPKCCPLVFPAVCPECKQKFFQKDA